MLIELSIACMAVIITSFVDIPNWLDRKPFNCVVCLAFWAALIYELTALQPLHSVLFYPFLTAYAAYILKKLMHI
jgi:hypothetical protein